MFNIIINQVRLLLTYTKNPIRTLLFYFGLKKDVVVNLKQYDKIYLNENKKDKLGIILYSIDQIEKNKINKKEEFKTFLKECNKDIVTLDNVEFYNNEFSGVLWEYFWDNPFLEDDFKNRTIIDIGANIGDTALFMANKGATVFAFEPVPETYEIAKKNIDLNSNLKNNISLFNHAISGKHEFIKIFTESPANAATANSFIEQDEFIEIEALTISQILEKYNIEPDILKMDCEGAEYSIVENSDLSCFNKIMLEYHEEFVKIPYRVIVDRLKSMGFNVSVKGFSPYNLNQFGFIIAIK